MAVLTFGCPSVLSFHARISRQRPMMSILVDGNQLCDLGYAAQIVLFYRGLAAIAQSEQRLDIRDLPDSVNA